MRAAILYGVFIGFGAWQAQANEFVKRPFEVNVKESDLIIIGVAISDAHRLAGDRMGEEYVTVSVETVIKGPSTSQVDVLVSSDAVESIPGCCVTGARYLFLLEKNRANRYVPVNGRFGMIKAH